VRMDTRSKSKVHAMWFCWLNCIIYPIQYLLLHPIRTVGSGASICGPSKIQQILVGCGPGKLLLNDKCELCGPGSFSVNYSNLQCDPCSENFFSPISGASSCIACGNGQESSKGASQCKDQDYQKEANLATILGSVIGGVVGVIGIAISLYMCFTKPPSS
jgi:hypothetical protein